MAAFALVVNARDDATTSGSSKLLGEPGPPVEPALQALVARGNVVVVHPRAQRGEARELVTDVTGLGADAQGPLLRAGQGIALREEEGLGTTAYGGDRRVAAASPGEAEVRAFAEFWLGRTDEDG